MALGFFERIYARSEIKDSAAQNKETFLDAACAGGATPLERELLEIYYDASTELLLDNLDKLSTDSTPNEVIELMAGLVVEDVISKTPGLISDKIQEKNGLDLNGQRTPDIPEDDLPIEDFINLMMSRVDKGYQGIFQKAQKQENDKTPTSTNIDIKSIENGTPEIIKDETQDTIKIGRLSASQYFTSFADPALALQRIEITQVSDPATQPAAQNDETYTTTLSA